MRIMTLKQVVEEFRKQDPESAVNETMLTELIDSGRLIYDKHGNRTVTVYDKVVETFDRLLDLYIMDFPRIRTVTSAIAILKKMGYSAEKVRQVIRFGVVPTIPIGSRSYIALEQFEWPHAEKLFRCKSLDETERASAKREAAEQVGSFITEHSDMPAVKRKRNER